jgi:predicted RNA-binding protein with PUA-like domain
MPFLLKTEPTVYSFADLERDGETTWDGIKNAQALNSLAAMKPGEKLLIYHSVTDKAVVGTAKVVKVDASDPKNPLVRIAAGKKLKHPKTLAEIKQEKLFDGSILFRQFRLSVVPITAEQYAWLIS